MTSGLKTRQGGSRDLDARRAAREFHAAVAQPGMRFVLFYCAPAYDLEALSEELRRLFADVEVLGCTTTGELAPLGYGTGLLTGVSIASEDVTVALRRLEELARFEFSHGLTRGPAAMAQLRARGLSPDPSVPGAGTRFTFTVNVPAAARSGASAAASSPSSLRGARVLLAEDNAVNQEVALSLLEYLGCHVTVADSGEKAVLALDAPGYRSVLMDCQMPGMDGFEAAREIRRREAITHAPRVPIIALTASTLREDRERCLAAGMDDFVSKPVRLEELRRTLARWIGGAPATEPRKTTPAPAIIETESEIDDQALRDIKALQRPGSPDLLQRIAGLFRERTPSVIAGIEAAATACDHASLAAAAHSLASSSACAGAMRLAEQCEQLERLASAADPEAVPRAAHVAQRARRAIAELCARFEVETLPERVEEQRPSTPPQRVPESIDG